MTIIASTALAAWASGRFQLYEVPPSLTMEPNTALAFALEGLALFLVASREVRRAWLSRLICAVLILLALPTLLRHWGILGQQVETLLFPSAQEEWPFQLGVLPPLVAACFLAEACALLVLSTGRAQQALRVAILLALAAALMSLVIIIGYFYRTPILYGASVIPMPLPTACAFLIGSSGVLALAGPEHWPMRLFAGESVRARLLRSFLPLTVGLILVDGWLKLWVITSDSYNPAATATLWATFSCLAVALVMNPFARSIGVAIERAQAERLRAEQETANLVELDRFKKEMTDLVVHDLKSPMAVIAMAVRSLEKEMTDASRPMLEALDDLQVAARRMDRLTANLRDMARLEENRLKLLRVRTDAMWLLRDIVNMRARLFEARKISVRVPSTAEGEVMIAVDQNLLTRVIENVLDNSLRYTPRDGTIEVGVSRAGDRVRIRLANTGTAIPEEHRKKIFEKYGQGRGPDDRATQGLGLYFCQLAVNAHGGRMWVESSSEFPTVFVIELGS